MSAMNVAPPVDVAMMEREAMEGAVVVVVINVLMITKIVMVGVVARIDPTGIEVTARATVVMDDASPIIRAILDRTIPVVSFA